MLARQFPPPRPLPTRFLPCFPGARAEPLAYCITHNHVHLLARIQTEASLCTWMQRAEGQWAQQYNRRKQRSGAFWEGRYHCTLIGDPLHTQRCMTYIEPNMSREPWWTESVAVGDVTFVRQVEHAVRWRQGFDRYAVSSETNCLREGPLEPAGLGPSASTPVLDVRGASYRPLPSLRARKGDKTSP